MLELAAVDSFYGDAHIVHGLSMAVAGGQVVALLGRNGAGKSTTLKSIAGLLRPARGAVRFQGRDLVGLPSYRICRLGVGYVPQERRIFSDLSVQENLEVGRRPPRPELPAWSEESLFQLFPNLAERRGNQGGRLSGGEQQMLTIARTLMGNPLLLLLDEPSEGLAPVIVEQMALAILKLKQQGMTILLSEQNLHFARLVADRAYIIEQGTLRYQGSIEELAENDDIRTAYLMV